jgi:cyclopropane fatty-acyl-phospholipid synthase-like methyltransferase
MLKNLLAVAAGYELFGRALGGPQGRVKFVRDYVKSTSADRVMDIGCGPGMMVPFLNGATYVGFDASAEYIDAARKRYGDRGTFVCDRVSTATLDAPGSYDIVLACGVIHHLDDEEAKTLFEIANAALKPGGRLCTFDGAYVQGQSRLARYMISRDRGQYVRRAEEYPRLAKSVFPNVRMDIRGDFLRIPYTLAVMTCVKAAH